MVASGLASRTAALQICRSLLHKAPHSQEDASSCAILLLALDCLSYLRELKGAEPLESSSPQSAFWLAYVVEVVRRTCICWNDDS